MVSKRYAAYTRVSVETEATSFTTGSTEIEAY